jgi:hypothetical protein
VKAITAASDATTSEERCNHIDAIDQVYKLSELFGRSKEVGTGNTVDMWRPRGLKTIPEYSNTARLHVPRFKFQQPC